MQERGEGGRSAPPESDLSMKKVIIRVLGIVLLAACAWGVYRFFQQLPRRQQEVATTRVRRDDLVIRAYSRGELRAVRSVTLVAPNLFSTVQVTRLAPMGSLAKEKDLIVEFDDSERRAQLEETLLEVEQIDEQIKKAKADLAVRDSQDQVDLLRTRYSVRRAELEVKRNEIISAIDAKKNLLTLEEERRRLKQLESDIKSRREQAQAELAVLYENRNKSVIDVARERQRIAQAKVLSPISGLVAIRQNRTGFFMFGQQIPDIREGDTLQPGMPVADVLDLSDLELLAKVGELDRANLHEGQDVLIQLDAVPNKKFHGKIKAMSGTASSNVFSGDPAKKFDVVFSIDMRQLLTELGVKPAQVARILETGARNAKKGPPPGVQVAGAKPAPGAGPGGAGAAAAAPAGVAPLGPGGPAASPVSPATPGGVPMTPGGPVVAGAPPTRTEGAGSMKGAVIRGGPPGGAGQSNAAVRSGAAGPPGMPALPGGPPADLARFVSAGAGPFSDEDRAKAKLPLPPEEDSQLQVLLRPGLLADIEIIVERIPNALHVPAQAVFQKEGKPIVYVKKNGRFEERPIQLARRSESVMVLAGGVQPGEIVALADPNVRQNGKQSQGRGKSKGIGVMPGGGN